MTSSIVVHVGKRRLHRGRLTGFFMPGEGTVASARWNDGGEEGDGDKTFKQADVDKIVQERIARERETRNRETAEKYGDLDDLKARAEKAEQLPNVQAELEKAKKELGEQGEKLKEATGKVEEAEAAISQLSSAVETLEKSVPEDRKSLIPSKLSPPDRLEFIMANTKALFGDGVKPGALPTGTTPPQGTQDGKPFGGFASKAEWASKDPVGYGKARDKGLV